MKQACENWLKFLDESIGDREVIEQLRLWVKNLVNGERNEKMLLLAGQGLGKSTTAHIISKLVEPHLRSYINTFTGFPLAELRGKRLNVTEGFGLTLEEIGKIKSILGGDSLTTRRKFKEPEAGPIDCSLIFTSGHIPKKFEGRVALIPFTRHPVPGAFSLTDILREVSAIRAWAKG